MIILIVYVPFLKKERNTYYEYLYSFQKYSNSHCLYLNAREKIPSFILNIKFDLIVYHYTFLSMRWGGLKYFKPFLKQNKILKKLKGYKIALPQDEYINTDHLCRFFKDFKVKSVFTCLPQEEWERVYPKSKSGLRYYSQIFAGYVDEKTVPDIEKHIKPHDQRKIDIGYRARKLPYWIGEHASMKARLTDIFRKRTKWKRLRTDLSNEDKDVFYGEDWYHFLSTCRTVLGCESGAGLYDPVGAIRKKTDAYVASHPQASFHEVKKNVFKDKDNKLNLFGLSPRHFEASITKTCQVLVEGKYNGVLKPWRHYIPIKSNFRNIDKVLDLIKDKKFCEQIAENCYKDIVESKMYTYRNFVKKILNETGMAHRFGSNMSLDTYFYIARWYLFLIQSHIENKIKETYANIYGKINAIQFNLGLRKVINRIINLQLNWGVRKLFHDVVNYQLNWGVRKRFKSIQSFLHNII